MPSNPWSKFFWQDWEADPGLRLSSLAAQGLWMRCLCICARSQPTGYLVANGRSLDSSDLARLIGVGSQEVESSLAELERNAVFSRDASGRIFSRRLVRDARQSAHNAKNGQIGGLSSRDKQRGIFRSPERPVERQAERPIERASEHPPEPHKPEARVQKPDKPPLSTPPLLDDFERWWKIYARKEGKGQARRAYAGARAKASAEVLEAGARRYAAARVGEEPRYTRLPATWLNGESWLDEGAGPTGEGASLTGDQQATVRSRIAALTATGMDQAGIKALRPWELTAEAESRVREAMEQRKNAHVACST